MRIAAFRTQLFKNSRGSKTAVHSRHYIFVAGVDADISGSLE